MANINSTLDRAAQCGACGQTRARHIWGPEQASMAGSGCSGWTAGDEGAAPAAPSDRLETEHTQTNNPFGNDGLDSYAFKLGYRLGLDGEPAQGSDDAHLAGHWEGTIARKAEEANRS